MLVSLLLQKLNIFCVVVIEGRVLKAAKMGHGMT
jgi:hypothetical protein